MSFLRNLTKFIVKLKNKIFKRKWIHFADFNINTDPHRIIKLILNIPSARRVKENYDSLLSEVYFVFEIQNYKFAMHNPYGGVYGFWFFYDRDKNNILINEYFIDEFKIEIEREFGDQYLEKIYMN